MIVLTVLSYNGAPANGPAASFDELGGTIGRADNNQLVLPDPERTISRVHARVSFRNGTYAIVDNGSNPISVNGRPLGSGREHPLSVGDEIEIGGYRLRASAAASPAASADPFADLFGPAAGGLAVPLTEAAPARSPMRDWAPPPAPAAAPALAPGHIPDDWNPFAPEPAAAPATAAWAPPPPPPGAGSLGAFGPAGAAGSDSLDDLFGLSKAPPSGDPFGAAPAQSLGLQPNMAAHADPLQSLARAPAPSAPASLGSLGSELNTPMPLPAALPDGAVFSWDQPSREARMVTLPYIDGIELQPATEGPRPAPRPLPAPPPRAAAVPRPAGDEALLAALLDGLGVPSLRIEALTPELMRLVGTLLRESTRGAVELLVARAALKREMRAEMTMIVARENNPLKFSPTAEVALQHLLGPQAPGFMPPGPAMRDAFDDLRAHQLGVMAGMKAALDGVLQRFDPQQLEGQLTTRSTINSLIPAMRKARLWELFNELFTQLQSEAQDDFDELFGKAFLRAYQAQLDRLSREG